MALLATIVTAGRVAVRGTDRATPVKDGRNAVKEETKADILAVSSKVEMRKKVEEKRDDEGKRARAKVWEADEERYLVKYNAEFGPDESALGCAGRSAIGPP